MAVDVSKLASYAVLVGQTLDVSKLTTYAIVYSPPDKRLSQIITEPLTTGTVPPGDTTVRMPWIISEPTAGGPSVVRCPWIVLECLSAVPEEPPVATDVLPLPSPVNAPLIGVGLPGLTFSSHKKPMWRTEVASAVNGKEVRTARMEVPIWQFELKFDFLDSRDDAEIPEQMETMAGFFNLQRGKWGAWLYQDPTDYEVQGQALGVGDGGETVYYALHKFKIYTEPVGQVDFANLMTFPAGAVNAGTDTIAVANHGLDNGYGPVRLSNAGGALPTGLAANVNYWLIVLNDSQFKLADSYANAIAGTPVDITAAGSGTNTMRNGAAIYLNGTELSPDDYTIATNQITFDSAPGIGDIITGDYKFYFVCRFMDDLTDFEQFMYKLWTLETLEFQSDIQ